MVECERSDAMRSAGSLSPRSGIPAPAGRSGSGIKRPGSAAATMRPKVAKPPFLSAPRGAAERALRTDTPTSKESVGPSDEGGQRL